MVKNAPTISQLKTLKHILLKERIYISGWKILTEDGYIIRFFNVRNNSIKDVIRVDCYPFVNTEVIEC